MRNPSLLFGALGCAVVSLAGCSSDDDGAAEDPAPTSTVNGSAQASPAPTTTTPGVNPPAPGPTPSADRPGPAPAGCTGITKDKDGFFTRTTAQGSYVGYVPKAYTGQPSTLVVGIHGCGDSAMNFAKWGVNPYKTIATQSHIGISIGGRDGQCWDTKNDDPKVTAAIEDVAKCFYVHQQKVVLAGYSSGGILAYKMGLSQSAKYAGIIIENSGLGGAKPAGASWKINVAHIAHLSDESFPIAGARADWTKLEAAGIPLQKKEVPGTHDGTSDDWSDFLVPKIAAWKAP
ncbi:MAG TPA: hypothetical protein VLT33_51415 [Labilithrix sp.]|nr:hypothetical protein [Labilithrix sp.]